MSDLKGGRLDLSACEKVPAAYHQQLRDFALRDGDFLMGMTGSLENYALVGSQDLPALLNQRVGRLVWRSDTVEKKFAILALLSEDFKRHADKEAAGAAQKNISPSQIERFCFPCPIESSEQRRIAEILTTVDEAMEQTEALVGKLEQMKAGLMHDLFTRGVTPDGHLRPTRQEAPHLYHPTPLGWLPKEWSPGLLSDYLDPSNGIKPGPFGSSLTKDIYTSSGYRIYGQEQVIAGSLEVGDYYISAAKFVEMRMFEVQEGDILLSLVGTVGCVLVVEPPFEPGIINPRLMRLRPLPGRTVPQFIRHLLLTADIRRQIDSLAGGGTMPVINGKVIRRLRAPLIERKEQERIVQRIASLEAKIESSTTHLAKLRQQKQGLMQDLLTGRVRVKAPGPS